MRVLRDRSDPALIYGRSRRDGSRVVSDPLADTGITCGAGAGAFDIFGQDTYDQHATRGMTRTATSPAGISTTTSHSECGAVR
jgi:hypothetical protein